MEVVDKIAFQEDPGAADLRARNKSTLCSPPQLLGVQLQNRCRLAKIERVHGVGIVMRGRACHAAERPGGRRKRRSEWMTVVIAAS
jgi:hypothetical protein